MPHSSEPAVRSVLSAAACQYCGAGCTHASAIHPQWQGDWIWCEHPLRLHAARLIRADSECERFQSPHAPPPA